jgi:hypothetical protein
VKIILAKGRDVFMTLFTHFTDPVKDIVDGFDRLTHLFIRAPVRPEDVAFGWYNCGLKPLEEDSYVRPLPVGDVPHVPENAETYSVGYPKELFLFQAGYFSDGVGVPEALTVQKMSYVFPLGHNFSSPNCLQDRTEYLPSTSQFYF